MLNRGQVLYFGRGIMLSRQFTASPGALLGVFRIRKHTDGVSCNMTLLSVAMSVAARKEKVYSVQGKKTADEGIRLPAMLTGTRLLEVVK